VSDVALLGMPELPEVETIRRDLARVLIGQKVVDFKADKPRLLRSPLKLYKIKLVGATILSVKRRAKLLLFELSSDYVLIIHLKMTGQLVWRSQVGKVRSGGHPIQGVDQVPNKFTYITLKLSSGGKLFFNDVRQFGYWQLIPKRDLLRQLQHYGPEPLARNFSLNEFSRRLGRHANTTIKSALLNQTVVAGLGNIYVDETLFAARVRPIRKVSSLKNKETMAIHQAIIKILKKAVAARGTSFNTYVDAKGRSGSYWRVRYVYGRPGQKCLKCGQVIKRTIIAGRGTHYCASCQK